MQLKWRARCNPDRGLLLHFLVKNSSFQEYQLHGQDLLPNQISILKLCKVAKNPCTKSQKSQLCRWQDLLRLPPFERGCQQQPSLWIRLFDQQIECERFYLWQ